MANSDAELMESITKQAAERGITYGAIVALIGAIDSFTVSTTPAADPTAHTCSSYPLPAEMTATGEVVDGKPHIHAVMAVQGDRTIGGHLHKAQLGTSFARAYVIPAEYHVAIPDNEQIAFAEAPQAPADRGTYQRRASQPAVTARRGATMIPDTTQATRELADGNEMPLLGLGVWQVPDGPECVNAVRWALELGYRHIDTAQAYRNESSVGKALKDSGVDLNEVFITTKFLPRAKDPVAEAEQSLRRLGVDQVDLYLVHWPQDGPTWAWPGMERARELGYARSIGVSNFSVAELDSVAAIATVMPAVNQVNFNPSAFRRALLDACQRHGVTLEAYSPLGTGRLLSDPAVGAIAARVGRTSAQVLLRWCVQRGVPVLSKSTHRDRIAENGRIFDFELTGEELAQLDALDHTGGTGNALERKWW